MIRKKRARFSDKKHSVKGIISLVIGIISLILTLVLFYLSAQASGNGGVLIGFIGVILLISTIVGIALGYQGYKEKEIYYYPPVIGLVMNSLIFLILFILYIVGLVT